MESAIRPKNNEISKIPQEAQDESRRLNHLLTRQSRKGPSRITLSSRIIQNSSTEPNPSPTRKEAAQPQERPPLFIRRQSGYRTPKPALHCS
ncbi:hypothetical protein C922_05735 [Plasmodium inui San Antonio 1]|uniref:Uncharacterized protein n=1 Tax=Plasmodium inui San Antonio 1 TaxID=1237626 RepID=W6ZX49_9APIC|nr:hypothetical protein C922_05735 [Plasmodium inui San Antonio 1]EUD63883.1 hypothetical protein C922_05735 [Plasmodium inui San Antonio 1]